jgi:type IV pilus assembly protein PilA
MKKLKKNNKGFSLVELIVVVLIMAIIAVALAPQVMKWVDNSRVATDASTYDSLVANCQIALTDSAVYSKVKDKTITVEMSNTGVKITGDSTDKAFETELGEIMDLSQCKSKVKDETYDISVSGGVVKKGTNVPDVKGNADLNGGIS